MPLVNSIVLAAAAATMRVVTPGNAVHLEGILLAAAGGAVNNGAWKLRANDDAGNQLDMPVDDAGVGAVFQIVGAQDATARVLISEQANGGNDQLLIAGTLAGPITSLTAVADGSGNPPPNDEWQAGSRLDVWRLP